MNSGTDDYARWNSLRADVSQLRSTANAVEDEVNAATDLRAIASACHALWMHIETVDVFMRDLLVEERLSSDARAADPLDAIRTYLVAARAQVTGVMGSEYDVDIARKRLSMSLAVSGTVLNELEGYVDSVAVSGN